MKGLYTLILFLKKDDRILRWNVKRGYLYYTGSGMNNLESRVKRHFRNEKKLRWHIDHLTSSREVKKLGAVMAETDRKMECEVNMTISRSFGIVIKGFGSSDCRSGCGGHLIWHPSLELEAVLDVYRGLGLRPFVRDKGLLG